ncbi:hypothetical protein KSP40_PGU009855 [Platanthera guangdongensis]|uniref:Uncharacterized protein n=1 Tax=Platanthera guangdongensis TaxID=2320717 RepID=A0ABR2MNV9_9ASPA
MMSSSCANPSPRDGLRQIAGFGSYRGAVGIYSLTVVDGTSSVEATHARPTHGKTMPRTAARDHPKRPHSVRAPPPIEQWVPPPVLMAEIEPFSACFPFNLDSMAL